MRINGSGWRKRTCAAAAAFLLLAAAGCSGATTAGLPEADAPAAVPSDGGPGAAENGTGQPAGPVAAALDLLAAGTDAEFSVAVRDNASGESWQYNAQQRYLEASLVKVPILLTLIRQATAEGRDLTAEEVNLATLMIEYSDNEATSALYDGLGGRPELQRTYELIGVEATEAGEMWGASETTAEDQLRISRTVAEGADWLDPDLLAFGVALMENVCPEQSWGITAGVGAPDAQIGLKNGWLQDDEAAWNVGSAGFIRAGGNDYSIVVLSARNPTLADGIDVVESVASTVNGYTGGS
ncbi:class A beta-lactamase-related serine hydrolase [Arthrobacter zhangbolii]|uniref:Class A beta-lactamase-related serine hydrolase n=1 Tax=Arthrobacter zhangbolii TaxID=2886936 RepID=A0A9X1M5D7_9MICC|nr:serine hydrolase [Arthrobacter zhangbolii]MCC3271205.1 class A beta-lactamase-related serine hydrolase [Arthrobacter zhangbolii]UON91001.1 class A beta-lactamase-related serine hydrolase [Arthrobacter zhangbolii]